MKFLLFLLLCSTALAVPGDWRITWWNAANSMQQPIIARADPLKPSVLVGVTPDNIPVQANLGTGLVHDASGKFLNVDFTGYATTASLSNYVLTANFDWANLGSKPTLFSGSYADLTGRPTLFSGAYSDLTGKPSLFDGQYSSLTGIPSTFTPSAHTHAQSDVTGLVAALAEKEASIAIGTTSQYWRGDKTWQTFPTIPTNTNQLTNGAGFITGITSGNITTALGFTPYSTTNPNGYTSNTGTVTSIAAGTGLSGGTITTSGTISMPNTGTVGTYGVVTTDAQGRVTAGKRSETYSGTTNASGVYTVTFTTAYPATPNIQAGLINGADNQNLRVTAISTTGFTVLARNRVDVIGLLPTWTNVSGIGVDVLITEK